LRGLRRRLLLLHCIEHLHVLHHWKIFAYQF